MAKVYFPIRYEDVPASAPHPRNTYYRVSIGIEHWDDAHAYVAKVQMVHDGQVYGRKAPSYPEASDDLKKVMKAMKRIRKWAEKKGNGKRRSLPDSAPA